MHPQSIKVPRICQTCGKEFLIYPSDVKNRPALWCSIPCRHSKSIEERFWAKVVKSDGCWLWTGSKDHSGYGLFGIRGVKTFRAHCFSYELTYGPIQKGLYCLHKPFICASRACIRPDHLYAGTPKENVRDMISEGHLYLPRLRGEDKSNAKLTEDAVREIRDLYRNGMTQTSIAAQYGIHQMTVSDITTRRTWKHI